MYHIRYWSNGSQFDPPLSSHETLEEAKDAVKCFGDEIWLDDKERIMTGKELYEERHS